MPKKGGRGGSSRGEKRRVRSVPYARGYHPPSQRKREGALGKTAQTGKEFRADPEFFSAIPGPTSVDDWLAQYNEEGQTFDQFLSQCPWLSGGKRGHYRNTYDAKGGSVREKYPGAKIYLQPIGNFHGRDVPNFDDLAEYADLFFCLPVDILPAVALEEDGDSIFWVESPVMKSRLDGKAVRKSPRATKCRLDFRKQSGHLQLKCASVLSRLRRTLPDDALCLIGLTMFDLYDDDPDLFVAGLAAGNHGVAVFSFFRYDPTLTFSSEFWYDVRRPNTSPKEKRSSGDREKKILLQRGCKLLVHELGHLLGFDHCVWFACLMNGSGHLEEDFRQPMMFCPIDLHKLKALTECDISARYAGLLRFFRRCGFEKEADWVDRRLVHLRDP